MHTQTHPDWTECRFVGGPMDGMCARINPRTDRVVCPLVAEARVEWTPPDAPLPIEMGAYGLPYLKRPTIRLAVYTRATEQEFAYSGIDDAQQAPHS